MSIRARIAALQGILDDRYSTLAQKMQAAAEISILKEELAEQEAESQCKREEEEREYR